MSQMPVTGRPAVRAPRRVEPARPQLRVVPATAPRSARRLPFVVLCSFVLAAGLLLLLFLNMSLARGSYALHDLQNRSAVLAEQEQARHEQLAQLESPTALAERATALGMVQGVSPAVLTLPSGQPLGVPQEAPAASSADASTESGASTGASGSDATSGADSSRTPGSASSNGADTSGKDASSSASESTSTTSKASTSEESSSEASNSEESSSEASSASDTPTSAADSASRTSDSTSRE